MTLLLAGGCADPNLGVLAAAAQKAGIDVLDLRLPLTESPAFCWNPQEAVPWLSDRPVHVTGAFIRNDVFAAMKDPRPVVTSRALAWFQTVLGWLLSQPQIRMFNRNLTQAASNKPAVLAGAFHAGLRIPPTLVTNDPGKFSGGFMESGIAKPVLGGDYCYLLSDALATTDLRSGLAPRPAIVQKRLVAPEVRIYVIAQAAFAFEVRSPSLDYRVNQDAELILLPEVPQEVSLLRKLMVKLGLDFGAADFKTDPDTGQLCFLELNTGPMFARFDQISGGKICDAILQELAVGGASFKELSVLSNLAGENIG